MVETRKLWKRDNKNHQMDINVEKVPNRVPSWSLRAFFSRKPQYPEEEAGKKKKKVMKFGCSVSLCKLKDSSRIMQKAQISCKEHQKNLVLTGKHNDKSKVLNKSLREIDASLSSIFTSSSYSASSLSANFITPFSSSSTGGALRGSQLRRLSAYHECHSILNPMDGILPNHSRRVSTFTCPECGKMFMRFDSLETHQADCHAVSELTTEDTSRNIIEIIFQSSWLKKPSQSPSCKIDRILKINSTKKIITKFEDYRDYIKTRSSGLTKKYPRCTVDGNELLRFVSTNFTCSIGLNGSTNLCHSIPRCSLCSIIKDGLKVDEFGRICTMATSKGAHNTALNSVNSKGKAVLVCRVIAGRVKKDEDDYEEHDSVAGPAKTSNLDELFVSNPDAVLPCFLVIYRSF